MVRLVVVAKSFGSSPFTSRMDLQKQNSGWHLTSFQSLLEVLEIGRDAYTCRQDRSMGTTVSSDEKETNNTNTKMDIIL